MSFFFSKTQNKDIDKRLSLKKKKIDFAQLTNKLNVPSVCEQFDTLGKKILEKDNTDNLDKFMNKYVKIDIDVVLYNHLKNCSMCMYFSLHDELEENIDFYKFIKKIVKLMKFYLKYDD